MVYLISVCIVSLYWHALFALEFRKDCIKAENSRSLASLSLVIETTSVENLRRSGKEDFSCLNSYTPEIERLFTEDSFHC